MDNKPTVTVISGANSPVWYRGAFLIKAPSYSALPEFSGQCQLLLVAIEMQQLMVCKP